MVHPLFRSTRTIGRLIGVSVALLALGAPLVSVAAYPGDFGPQLSVDKIVAERGATVTITANGFAPNQQLALTVRTSSGYDQGTLVATLPLVLDSNGSGSATVATSALATGDYIVTADGVAGLPLASIQTAFGVINPGTVGPRVVRVAPLPPDEA